jgi:uncharacterized integral membrane protein
MIRKLVMLLLLVVIAVALIAFAVANRQPVNVALDPFDQTDPALVFSEPEYLLVFGALIGGVLIGGCATWLGQGKWRKRARRAEADARALRAQLIAQPSPQAGAPAGLPATTPPAERLRLIVPPPAA